MLQFMKHAQSADAVVCLAMQLPDGNEIQIGPERFGVPELLFQPVRLLAYLCLTAYYNEYLNTDLPTHWLVATACDHVGEIDVQLSNKCPDSEALL